MEDIDKMSVESELKWIKYLLIGLVVGGVLAFGYLTPILRSARTISVGGLDRLYNAVDQVPLYRIQEIERKLDQGDVVDRTLRILPLLEAYLEKETLGNCTINYECERLFIE